MLSCRVKYLTENTNGVLYVDARFEIEVDVGGVAIVVEVAKPEQCAALELEDAVVGW